MGIERTAAHRLLRTLAETGMASNDGNGSYSIGSRALTVGLSSSSTCRCGASPCRT